jgi:hypothetical protein
MQTAASAQPEWWAGLPDGERELIRAVARMLRGARRSHLHGVARAARKWESSLNCFIKVRLINERTRKQKRLK